MGLRAAVASRLTKAALALGGPAPESSTAVEKAFGSNEPPAMAQAAHEVSQMDMQHPFAPGEPIGPYDGYSRTPRSFDYQTAVNIATRPRTHELVSFDALKGLIGAYDVANICIWHRIDSIRSLDWKLVAADGYAGDVTDAIAIGMAALEKPDRINSFGTWLAKYLWNILAYDAGALFRMRNRANRCVGLKVVDGPTIAPLLDYWGDPPEAPAEAYVQYANGVPWGWLTRDDLIYEPFRPRTDSPYGTAPLESIMLNANTDIRFQWHFLQRFTEGNIPAAFASAPESWTPKQIDDFQAFWDSFMYGDQSRKSQIRWLPGGSTFTWTNEKDFTDAFSLFMMRKSCAAYHIVPTDIGFTENSNYSTGESQADVGHRVGDLPLGRHVERILTGFLQSQRNGLGLPLKHQFDWGEEQDDRYQQAQADQLMIDRAVISSSEVRQMRYGLAEPEGQVVPRFIYSPRAGAIPLSALYDVAGPVDVQTAAPEPGQPLPHHEFAPIEGVVPVPPPKVPALAERLYGPDAIPPPPPEQAPVAKEAAALPAGGTEGVTSETGIYGYDGPGSDDDEDGPKQEVLKEIATFRRFARTRIKAGQWRDFEFAALPPVAAHNLNDAGRFAVRKAAGEVAVAGLCVQAADTGRVLMLQRALDPADPAGGTWEFPGGHIDGDESPLEGAWREFCEETGCAVPPGEQTGTWTAGDGIYQGIVWTIAREAAVPPRADTQITNPDDPDGDATEAIAWWSPQQFEGNPALRAELAASLPDVLAALGSSGDGQPSQGDESTCPCGTPVVYDEMNGWQHADGSISHDGGESVSDKMAPVAKAAPGPKAPAPAGATTQPPPANQPAQQAWPGWRLTDQAVAYWALVLAAAIGAVLTAALLEQMAADYLAAFPGQQGDAPGKQARNDAAHEWLVTWLAAHGVTLDTAAIAAAILADGYLIGAASASAVASGAPADTGAWVPGGTAAAQDRVADLGGAAALAALLAAATGETAGQMQGAVQNAAARTLAGANGDTSPKVLAAALAAAVLAGAFTAGLALAVLCDTVAKAAHDFYCGFRKSPPVGLGDFQWVTDPELQNCAICLANEAAPARPYGDPWPSGDVVTGIHIKCGCALIPVRR